jgi:surfeit locus 1 family protein
MTTAARPYWRRLLVPGLLTIVGLAILIGLGTWQLQRLEWKEALIATLEAQLKAPPVPLPPPSEWPALTPENSEFRRIRLTATFEDENQDGNDVLVYTGSSALRPDVKGPGYFVFTPATLPDGRKVVVNRGFVRSENYPKRAGTEQITGYIRFTERPSLLRSLVSGKSGSGRVFTERDHLAMAQAKGWGEVAPFYIDQDAPVPAAQFPQPGPLTVKLRNDHLGYAITWFGLAASLLAVFLAWAIRQRYNKTT